MKESVDAVITAIKPLAEKLGEGAAHLYQVYTKQMVAEGIGDLVAMGIFWLLFVVLCIALAKVAKKSKWDYGEPDNAAAGFTIGLSILGVILFIIGIIWTFSSVTTDVTKIVNPEYHAVQRILETVNPKPAN